MIKIRLGGADLLLHNYEACATTIYELRAMSLDMRTAAHLDYLDARYLETVGKIEQATEAVNRALNTAIQLEAAAEEARYRAMIERLSPASP